MTEQSWSFIDKSAWPQGPWHDEPDKVQWIDPVTNLDCLIVRNNSGALCGYVGVSEGHSLFEKEYGVAAVQVHGGLTFASFCQGRKAGNEHGICHVPAPGRPERVWWL